MRNRRAKKISVLVLASFICAAGIGNLPITSAKQESSIPGTEMDQESATSGLKRVENFVDKRGVYTNFQANFSFKPPSSWNGHYKVSQYAGADANEDMPSAKYVVSFDYVTKDGEDVQSLVRIYVFGRL